MRKVKTHKPKYHVQARREAENRAFPEEASKYESPTTKAPDKPKSFIAVGRAYREAYGFGVWSTRPSFERELDNCPWGLSDKHGVEPNPDSWKIDPTNPEWCKIARITLKHVKKLKTEATWPLQADPFLPEPDSSRVEGLEHMVFKRSKPVRANQVYNTSYAIGDEVKHSAFGKGFVVNVELSSEVFLTINFPPSVGQKKIASSFVECV